LIASDKIVMGIDPGLRHTGFAIVQKSGRKVAPLEYDLIKTPGDKSLSSRLETIFQVMSGVIERHRPDAVAIEELFFGKNAASAIAVGHARGVMIVAARLKGVPVFEYTGLEVKMALTGYGRADKGQVAYMVRQALKMKEDPKPRDVTDALAICLCHLQTRNFDK
jgi:crossover junction endodeoxyribonuclease RuvC